MRVVSCNINGRVGSALDRQLTRLLRSSPQADIVALQEVTSGNYADWCDGLIREGYSVVSAVDLLGLPYPPPPYPSPPFPPKDRGQIQRKYFNLLAARHPIATLPGLSFPNPDEALYAFPEKYVAARVRVDGVAIDVHNAHLPPGASRGVIKVHAFEAIRRRLDEDGSSPTILCGDFNAPWAEDAGGPLIERDRNWDADIKARWTKAERALIANPRMRDVYRDVHALKETFPASHHTGSTSHRYDYVFASSDLRTASCEYLVDWLERDEEDRRLSDHVPVEAELTIVR